MNHMTSALAADYDRDGFVFPLDILSAEETLALREDLEAAEAACAHDPKKLGLLRGFPARVLPSFDRLIRHPEMVKAATAILGPDVICWGSGLFIKEAHTPSYVTWHQDLTYWGLDQDLETTLWVALSPATRMSGCMRFIPGTHKQEIVPHADSFAKDNLLSRGQEVQVEVNEATAVDAELQRGQASVHHGHLFHASGPNKTGDRRIGAAIRYIAASMKPQSGPETEAALVAGRNTGGNFTIPTPPRARLSDADFTAVAADSARRSNVLFAGAAQQGRRR